MLHPFNFLPKNFRQRLALLALLLAAALGGRPALALQGNQGAHDPSAIVKDGNTYWTFTTGQGISSLFSTDLVRWNAGPRAVFPNNQYPSWINARVPGFTGHFWAPELVFMNNRYYLYYSCSSFGSRVSAIGLVTNATLDPNSPNYRWVDEGEVISTNNGSAVNAIDAAIFRDTNGDTWLSYGSFFGGIRITQLNPATGKVINQANQAAVVNADPEAAYLTKNGGYYYLFFNRGACCQGSNSTYYMLVGRSTSPTGPFLDQNGVNTNNGGGTVVLNVSGRYVGPGHAGILTEGGVNYLSHHYYDFEDNGAPKLGLAKLTWSATGWPEVTRDWVAPGRYEIAGANGQLWETRGCTGTTGQAITQGTRSGLDCQKWDFTPLGDGDYKITSLQGGLAATVAGCSPANGALLQLGSYSFTPCKQFHIDRAADGTLVFASLNGNRVVEVPGNSATPGQQLGLFDYNNCPCQRWTLTNTALSTAASVPLPGASLFPVPATRHGFTVELGSQRATEAVTVEVFNLQGQRIYHQLFAGRQSRLSVETSLPAGIYLVQVRQGRGLLSQKLPVL